MSLQLDRPLAVKVHELHLQLFAKRVGRRVEDVVHALDCEKVEDGFYLCHVVRQRGDQLVVNPLTLSFLQVLQREFQARL